MKETFYFYFGKEKCLNDATSVYVKTIEQALINLGFDIKYKYNPDEVPMQSKVLTIRDMDCFKIQCLRKPSFIINWYQGIIPEEASLTFDGKFSKYFRVILHQFLEKFTLNRNSLNIYVSTAMRDHFEKKYGIKKRESFVMPCFNTDLNFNTINKQRYVSPTFVYAGSMAKWQCIELMLGLFKKIKSVIPSATLNIFTAEKDKAQEYIMKYDIEASVVYLSPEKLNEKLAEFKYGFIIRDNIVVNNVATPTKMNTYMANGLIPVYSDVIHDYKTHISSKTPYAVPVENVDDCVRKILKIEETDISIPQFIDSYKSIFQEYWNTQKYIKELSEKINLLLKK